MVMKNYYSQIGLRIAKLRRERHITQETFAEVMDISIKHCSHVERGIANYSLEKLICIADYFGVSLDYLVHGINTEDAALAFPRHMIDILQSDDEQEKALLRDYLNMYGKLHSWERGE